MFHLILNETKLNFDYSKLASKINNNESELSLITNPNNTNYIKEKNNVLKDDDRLIPEEEISCIIQNDNLNNKNDLNNLMNHIRKSHFNFGDMKNDFSTTSGNTYKYDPDAAKKANSRLNNELLKDLQSTHYKLGYDNDVGLSTQKKDFIPYGLNANTLGKINPENSFNFGDNNKFDGISIYKSDYVEKEIPADGNDCWC